MVLCFVVQQYYQVADLLTETLLQAVQTHRNAAQRETQERVYRINTRGFHPKLARAIRSFVLGHPPKQVRKAAGRIVEGGLFVKV